MAIPNESPSRKPTSLTEIATHPPSVPGDAVTLPPSPPSSDTATLAPTASTVSAETSVVVPGYEIIRELGRGGMGVVYQARHIKLNRPVALKMILAGSHAGAADLARFQTEAEAIARVQHPNIVQIHEVGEQGGLPFFSLELCGGGSLEKKLAGTPLPPREAAALVEALARAMQAAHEKGVIHRDLKPANVLLAEDGTPKITDFGLAKKLDEAGQTQSGSVMGTPSYMAPEQACGKSAQVGPLADVYALGAVLYECLTGRPPFRAATQLDTIIQVVGAEPVPPARLQPHTPRDLETICLKCLHKDPARRYATAEELADDLRRYLQGEPIQARPAGRVERAVKWARRRPTAASLLAVCALAAIVGLAAGAWFAHKLSLARDQAEGAAADARNRAELESQARRETEAQKKDADEARRRAEITLSDMETSFGLAALDRDRPALAALWFASAAHDAAHDPQREENNRVRFTLSGRQAIAPLRALDTGEEVVEMSLHPDATHLITRSPAGHVALWDVDAERRTAFPGGDEGVGAAAWSPDGSRLAVGRTDGSVEVWGFPQGGREQEFRHDGPVTALTFSPDARLLAVAGNSVRVWDCRGRKFVTPAWPHPKPVVHLVFDSAGSRLATSCRDNLARLFDVAAPQNRPFPPVFMHVFQGFRGIRETWVAPAFLNHGQGLVTVPTSEMIVCYATEGFRMLWRAQTGAIVALRASPDQSRLAVGGYSGVQLYDGATGKPVGPLMPQKHYSPGLAFSADGRRLITGSFARTARVWSVPDGRPLTAEVIHQNGIQALATARGGNVFATAQFDGVIRLWRAGEAPLDRLPQDWPVSGFDAGVSVAGDRFAPVTEAPRLAVHSLETGRPCGPVLSLQASPRKAVFSPDGARVVTLSGTVPFRSASPIHSRGWVEVWSWKDGRPVAQVPTESEPVAAAFSPDNQRLAVACADGTTLLLDATTGHTLHRLKHPDPGWWYITPVSVTFHPSGDCVLVTGLGRKAQVIDVAGGRVRFTVAMADRMTYSTFSPDGRWVVTGSLDKEVRFWDVQTGREGLTPLKHPDWVFRLHFSADGRYLVTACRDGMARIWDWQRGEILMGLDHPDEVYEAAMSPDGRWVATFCRNGTLRLWEWLTGKPVSPPLALGVASDPALPLELHFTPDGRRLVAGSAAVFDLGPLCRPRDGPDRDDMVRLGRLLSGQAIRAGGNVANLTSDEWLDDWRQFRAAHPGPLTLPATQPPATPETGPEPATTVVELSAKPRHRDATPAQIARWVAELDGDKAGAARQALGEVGAAAKPALTAALHDTNEPRRRNAAATLVQIEVAEALMPPRIRLDLKDALPAEAFTALGEQAGVPVVYRGTFSRRIKVRLDNVPFQEALDRLCAGTGTAASVRFEPSVGLPTYNMVVSDAATGGHKMTADVGPFRISVRQVVRSVTFDTPSGAGDVGESLRLRLSTTGVASGRVMQAGPMRVARLTDAAGHPLELAEKQNFFALRPAQNGLTFGDAILSLKSPAEPGGKIKELRGELPVTVLVRPEQVAAIDDLARATEQTVPLLPGVICHVSKVSDPGTGLLRTLMLTLTSASAWQLDPLHTRVELVTEDGQSHLVAVTTMRPVMQKPSAAQVLILDGAPLLAGGPAIPWAGLALRTGSRQAPRSWILTLPLPGPGKGQLPRRLRLLQFREARVSLPFTLSDVPLP